MLAAETCVDGYRADVRPSGSMPLGHQRDRLASPPWHRISSARIATEAYRLMLAKHPRTSCARITCLLIRAFGARFRLRERPSRGFS
jgi:hypothetical protein